VDGNDWNTADIIKKSI